MKLRPREANTIDCHNSDLGSLRDNINLVENSSAHESLGIFNAATATDYATLKPGLNQGLGHPKKSHAAVVTDAFATTELIAAGSEGKLSSGSASRRARVRLKEQISYKHDYDSSSKANKGAKLEYWNMDEQDEESPIPKLPQKLSKIDSRSRRDSIHT